MCWSKGYGRAQGGASWLGVARSEVKHGGVGRMGDFERDGSLVRRELAVLVWDRQIQPGFDVVRDLRDFEG